MELHRTLPFLSAIGLVVVAFGGCGLDPGGAWNRTDGAGIGTGSSVTPNEDDTQPVNGSCPAPSPVSSSNKGPFEVCSASSECQQTCCSCPVEPINWLASSCINGTCADGATSCSRTQATYCSSSGAVVIGGGSSGGTDCNTCEATYCAAENAACSANQACVALESCTQQCGTDNACAQRCYDYDAAGAAALQNLDACIANSCGAGCLP